MHPDIKLILDLQSVDQRIAELQKEIAALPRHLAEIEKALDSHNRRLEADRAALAANQKERKRLEGDVQMQEQKISKLKSQMLEAKTNEQYRAFQHEIEFCENEIRKYEDRILELMAESEPLEKNVKAAEEALRQERAQVEAEKARVTARTAADKQQLEQLKLQREQISQQVKPALLNAYQRISKRWNTTNVAVEANEGRCTACHLALRPQFFQDLRKGDQVMFCESCGRILYYHPTIVVDEQSGGPVDSSGSSTPPAPPLQASSQAQGSASASSSARSASEFHPMPIRRL